MEVKSRHHLRSDRVDAIETMLQEELGVAPDADTYELVELTDSEFDLVLVDGEPRILYTDGETQSASESPSGGEPRGREPFVTVRGANAYEPESGIVTVDAGAIEFVSGGADVMRPGIVDADDDVEAGDLVVVNEEGHGKYLAVGRALVDGPEMTGDQGKVVENVHHVGDDLYEFSV